MVNVLWMGMFMKMIPKLWFKVVASNSLWATARMASNHSRLPRLRLPTPTDQKPKLGEEIKC